MGWEKVEVESPVRPYRLVGIMGKETSVCFASYGLRIAIRVNDPSLVPRLLKLLPPGSRPVSSPAVDRVFSLQAGNAVPADGRSPTHALYAGRELLGRGTSLEALFHQLESELHLYVAEQARRRVFVHAGVVGWHDQAIVIPGRSFSGKTTLVAALVRAGATYYSDDYAVLDSRGRVHPYPRPLSIREADGDRTQRCSAEALGGREGSRPLSVGLVVVTRYRPGARWRPRELSAGPAALALLDNAVPAIRRPAAVLNALQQVVSHSTTLKGVRGEAAPMVEALLKRLGA
jgi:hypothetical protein